MGRAEPRSPRARRFIIPEVVQTSSMDCGPASLRASFLGFGVDLGYDQLREACQTDVDGTSVDALASVANQLGLRAEQIYVPLDHLCVPEVSPFPALLVVRQPDGSSHVIVVWRRAGSLYQIMDPGTGRRWVTAKNLLGMAYEHEMEVALSAWREWAGGPEFSRALRRRMADIAADESLVGRASEDPSARGLASLDAAVRFVTAVARAGGLRRGRETRDLVTALFEATADELARDGAPATIPPLFFSALPVPAHPDRVLLRGAVLVRLLGLAPPPEDADEERPLKPETVASLAQPAPRPFAPALRSLREDGKRGVALLGTTLLVSALLAGIEAVLLRGSLEVWRRLGTPTQRMGAALLLLCFFALVLLVELWTTNAAFALGRRLELRLRVALFAKLPRLGDRYFQSRPQSDMAHRSHAIHPVRGLGAAGARLVRLFADLSVTAAALVWLHPRGAALIAAAALVGVLVPWASQRLLVEHDLRVRTYDGALVRFYLDALLGSAPVRAHGAERAVRWEHGGLVLEWAASARARLRVAVGAEVLQGVVSTALTILLVVHFQGHARDVGATLLFVYWALNIPALGQEIAALVRQLPRYRNLLWRVAEPLTAPEEISARSAAAPAAEPAAEPRSVAIRMEGVAVRASGRAILEGVDLQIAAGEHVAIVGASGAGKSSLVGLLLGWHRPAEGRVLVGGRELDGSALEWLRARTAWVDPSVMLWNRSLIRNIEYGAPPLDGTPMAQVLERADLLDVLKRMPDGLQTELGEGGGLVSGGEGQRVRLARAMTRASAGLVVLDEPFRGLDRDCRERLLTQARELWSKATLICITHDITETRGFDRVFIVEGGRVVEQGAPDELAAGAGRYRELLDAEAEARASVWRDPAWRRLRVTDAKVVET